MRKAQGISINVLIIAAVALVVLIVLIAIFSGKISLFSRNVSDCAFGGGKCMGETECDALPKHTIIPNSNCGTGRTCCVDMK